VCEGRLERGSQFVFAERRERRDGPASAPPSSLSKPPASPSPPPCRSHRPDPRSHQTKTPTTSESRITSIQYQAVVLNTKGEHPLQEAVRRARAGPRLSRPLHPSRRHRQQPHLGLRGRSCRFYLEGLSRRRRRRDHAVEARRVHPALRAPRLARNLSGMRRGHEDHRKSSFAFILLRQISRAVEAPYSLGEPSCP